MNTDLTLEELTQAMESLIETVSFNGPLPDGLNDPDPLPEDEQTFTVKASQTFYPA